jgi:hypothetical protein
MTKNVSLCLFAVHCDSLEASMGRRALWRLTKRVRRESIYFTRRARNIELLVSQHLADLARCATSCA